MASSSFCPWKIQITREGPGDPREHLSCAMGEPLMSSVECGGGSEEKKIGTKCFPVVLGGWFVLCRPKTWQIPVHSYPTNPKGCSTAVPGHPCSVTCPQPAQEKDLGEETAANPWFGCVTQVAQPRGGISRDLLGVQLPTRPSWDILCHSAKANLSLLCVSTLPA